MEKLKNYRIEPAQYRQPMTLSYRGWTIELPCGNADNLDLFQESDGTVYVLGRHSGLRYISLSAITNGTLAEEDNYFVYFSEPQIPKEIQAELTDMGRHADPERLVRMMAEYLPY